jgi:hypothetical protein
VVHLRLSCVLSFERPHRPTFDEPEVETSHASGFLQGGWKMAAQQASREDIEAAAERIRELNERVIEFGRKAGGAYLEAYEQTLKSLADYEAKLAEAGSQTEWITAFANAQADFTREIAKAYAEAGRAALK